MSETADLLVEIGTEELPPSSVRELSEAFASGVAAGLEREALSFGAVTPYATPRRLAVWIESVQTAQEERTLERRGPAVSAAFDADGNPTKAALGFASSCGVEVSQLSEVTTDKGKWIAFRTTEVGQSAGSLLPQIIQSALNQLPIRRRMRWSDKDAEFVRPVHWVVVLLGTETVETNILGVTSGRNTIGHRFHQPNAIPIEAPGDYASDLYAKGHVIAAFGERRETIRRQVENAGAGVGGIAIIDDALLDEVTALVEWPVPVVGGFDEEFLNLPDSVLVATLKGAQKYFPVAKPGGGLMAKFITISNIDSRNPGSVQAGNERVIRPRLKDAAFFFAVDRRKPLDEFIEGTKEVKFQDQLGSVYAKTQRVSKLAAHISIAMGQSPEDVTLARRAGQLSKFDLMSEMVGEFPELQGAMGREYALACGEPQDVAEAIGEVYLPRFAGDILPQTRAGSALAIADKLDTLVGIFGINELPKGDKDPFALRRQALGILRILIESELNLELSKLIDASVQTYGDLIDGALVTTNLFDFIMDRLKAYFLERGIDTDVFAAVMARRPSRPLDFAKRVNAVNTFRQLPEAAGLAAANKRINNILKQCSETLPETVDDKLFSEDAEWNLAAKLVGLGPRVREMLSTGNYNQAMTLLAGLRDSVDAFFDTVKVMTDDEAVRKNRLALLNNISVLFLATADISQLHT